MGIDKIKDRARELIRKFDEGGSRCLIDEYLIIRLKEIDRAIKCNEEIIEAYKGRLFKRKKVLFYERVETELFRIKIETINELKKWQKRK